MSNLTPSIGARGIYQLLAPFDTLLLPGVPYSCVAVRKLSDIIAAGQNPRDRYYPEGLGISDAKYKQDVDAGVCIISLQTGSEYPTYVPSTYIGSFPELGGIPYTTLLLGISLSAIPDKLDLSYVKGRVAATVLENLGVVAEVKTVVVSPTIFLSDEEHASLEIARQDAITNATTDRALLLAVTAQRDAALQKLTVYEQYIKDHLAPP